MELLVARVAGGGDNIPAIPFELDKLLYQTQDKVKAMLSEAIEADARGVALACWQAVKRTPVDQPDEICVYLRIDPKIVTGLEGESAEVARFPELVLSTGNDDAGVLLALDKDIVGKLVNSKATGNVFHHSVADVFKKLKKGDKAKFAYNQQDELALGPNKEEHAAFEFRLKDVKAKKSSASSSKRSTAKAPAPAPAAASSFFTRAQAPEAAPAPAEALAASELVPAAAPSRSSRRARAAPCCTSTSSCSGPGAGAGPGADRAAHGGGGHRSLCGRLRGRANGTPAFPQCAGARLRAHRSCKVQFRGVRHRGAHVPNHAVRAVLAKDFGPWTALEPWGRWGAWRRDTGHWCWTWTARAQGCTAWRLT